MRRAERAFTLLEVLAAVAILGILYTTLARVAMQGLQAEGESKRRLEASLLADSQIADIEMQMDEGIVPEIGETELEEDIFTVSVKIEPFTMPDLPEPTVPLPEDTPSILSSPDGAESPALRSIEVRVLWNEAEFERSVVRTTYAFDAASVADDLAAFSPDGGIPGATGATAGSSGDIGEFNRVVEQLRSRAGAQ